MPEVKHRCAQIDHPSSRCEVTWTLSLFSIFHHASIFDHTAVSNQFPNPQHHSVQGSIKPRGNVWLVQSLREIDARDRYQNTDGRSSCLPCDSYSLAWPLIQPLASTSSLQRRTSCCPVLADVICRNETRWKVMQSSCSALRTRRDHVTSSNHGQDGRNSS